MNSLRLLLSPHKPLLSLFRHAAFGDIAAINLIRVKPVEIDEGKSRYVLMEVYVHGDMAHSKQIVRSSKKHRHLELYDKIKAELCKLDICTMCLGGGYMKHDREKKFIQLYGRSKVVGKANHRMTRDVLEDKYPLYDIEAPRGGMEE